MKVFYTSPLGGRKKYQHIYDSIIKNLQHQEDVDIISLETLEYEDILGVEVVNKMSGDELHSEYLKRAINMSDAAIIEASHDSFKIGHETTLALLSGKPVLCLSTQIDYSQYLKHPLFFPAKISEIDELESIISRFLEDVRNKHLTIRLNSLISPAQSRFLEWNSRHTSRSKSEVIRNLIDSEKEKYPEFKEEDIDIIPN